MTDEMFYSPDGKSVFRGRRRAKRTDTCRPCLVWTKDAPDDKLQGVVMDISLFGMCVRMLEEFPLGSVLTVQMMRDDEYRFPLAPPREGTVVRLEGAGEDVFDHGIRLLQPSIKRHESPPIQRIRRPVPQVQQPSRMHTIELGTESEDDYRR